MFTKSLSFALAGLMFFSGATFQFLSAQTNADISAEKMKTAVLRRGTGEKSKVVVKMKNGTNLKGFISQAGEDSFDLADSKTKQTTAIAYRDVRLVKKPGLSTGAKIAIFGGLAAVVVVVVVAVAVGNVLDDFDAINIGQ